MIQQKQATDDAVYNRALQSDDPGMQKYIEWYDRGKKPIDYATPEKVKAREIVMDYLQDHTWVEAAENLGVHNNLIGHLRAERYRHFKQEKAEYILNKQIGL